MASDRMLTSSYPPIEFEHTNPKLFDLTETCVAMTAGDALKPVEIVPVVRNNLSERKNAPPVEGIVDLIKNLYQANRLSFAEEIFLKPRTIDCKIFYSHGSSIFPREIFGFIDDQFTRFDYGLDLLIAGIDYQAHIYAVHNPGIAGCYDLVGFHAIGVGQLHAIQAFVAQHYSVECSLAHAMNAVYAAKKSAETAPGVGVETDMIVITPDGKQRVSKSDLKTLDEIYREVTAPRSKEIEEASKKLKAAQDANAKKNEK